MTEEEQLRIREAKIEHRAVKDRLAALLIAMEHMGANDMEWLDQSVARKFHRATKLIRQVCSSKGIKGL
jgi:hypothetical protein